MGSCMARTTVADLLDRIEALEAEVEALRRPAEPPVSFVVTREAHGAPHIPGAIDFNELAESQGFSYAYSDPEWWGANRYL